eukprot:gene927-283_t
MPAGSHRSSDRASRHDEDLSHQLVELVAAEAPNDDRRKQVEDAKDLLQQVLTKCFGSGYTLGLQGSYRAGTSLQCSDVDCVILAPGSKDWNKMERTKTLQEMCTHIGKNHRKDGLTISQTAYMAVVPVVKLHYKPKNGRKEDVLELDVSVGDGSRGMCDASIRNLLASDENNGLAVCLCRMVKAWAKKHPAVCDTREGGLSTFGWVLLAISYLQKRQFLCSIEDLDDECMDSEPAVSTTALLALGGELDGEKMLECLVDVFEFFLEKIPSEEESTISVLKGRKEPGRIVFKTKIPFLCVEVPHPEHVEQENAARCLTVETWTDDILPVLQQAIHELYCLEQYWQKYKTGDRSRPFKITRLRTLFASDDAQGSRGLFMRWFG